MEAVEAHATLGAECCLAPQVFLLEFICTFVLVYVIFATAVDRKGAAANAAPLAIGLAVVACLFAEGPFTGGSMNPARSLGAAVRASVSERLSA